MQENTGKGILFKSSFVIFLFKSLFILLSILLLQLNSSDCKLQMLIFLTLNSSPFIFSNSILKSLSIDDSG